MQTIDVIQTLTEIASVTAAVKDMQNRLSDCQTKLQLSKSMIRTVIYELERNNSDWLIGYLTEGLERLE